MRRLLYDGLVENCRLLHLSFCLISDIFYLAAPGNWDHLLRQSGMFGFLGLSPGVVAELKGSFVSSGKELYLLGSGKHHIYMAANSRVSIAGLNPENVGYVAQSIAEVLKKE